MAQITYFLDGGVIVVIVSSQTGISLRLESSTNAFSWHLICEDGNIIPHPTIYIFSWKLDDGSAWMMQRGDRISKANFTADWSTWARRPRIFNLTKFLSALL